MLGRLVFTGAAVVALGAPAVPAAPIWSLVHACVHAKAQSTQCAFQTVDGDGNTARTHQTTEYSGSGRSYQLGLTYQKGDGNRSYIDQQGEDQVAVAVQVGNDNFSSIHQDGEDQFSKIVQIGNGHWAATSSVGGDSGAVVYQTN